MTEPTLGQPPAIVDPLAEFYSKDPVLQAAKRPTTTVNTDDDPNYAPLALALGGAFLTAAVLTARHITRKPPEDEDQARVTVGEAVTTVFQPVFIQQATPILLRMYVESRGHAGAFAAAHASRLAQMLGDNSSDAAVEGWIQQMGGGSPRMVAWRIAIAGFGLTSRDMRTFLAANRNDTTPHSGLVGPRATETLQRLLTRRADLIGRDEMFAATGMARVAGWVADQAAGAIPRAAKKRWVTAGDERVCPLCGPMEGKTVRLDQPFVMPNGTKLLAPMVHPNCRCTVALVNPRMVRKDVVSKAMYRTLDGKPDRWARDKGRFASRDTRGMRPAEATPSSAAATPAPALQALLDRGPAEPDAPPQVQAPAPSLAPPPPIPGQTAATVAPPPPAPASPSTALAPPPATPKSADPSLAPPPAAPQAGVAPPPPAPTAVAPPPPAPGVQAPTRVYSPSANALPPRGGTDPLKRDLPDPTWNYSHLLVPGNELVEYDNLGVGIYQGRLPEGAQRIMIKDPEDLEGMIIDFDEITGKRAGLVTGTTLVDHQRIVMLHGAQRQAALGNMISNQINQEFESAASEVWSEFARLDPKELQEFAHELEEDLYHYDLTDQLDQAVAADGSLTEWLARLSRTGPLNDVDAELLKHAVEFFPRSEVGQVAGAELSDRLRFIESYSNRDDDLDDMWLDNPAIVFEFTSGWLGVGADEPDEQVIEGAYRVAEVIGHTFNEDQILPSGMVSDPALRERMFRDGLYYVARLVPVVGGQFDEGQE